MLGDSAYGTGEMLAALDKAGHDAVIKPWPTRPAVEGGFTIDDFTYDDQAGTLTCPNRVTRRLTEARTVTFGAPAAAARCATGAPPPATGRTVKRPRATRALQRAHRHRAKDPELPADLPAHRPMVERSIAWLVRGNRRVPYRGVAKNNTAAS